jgi:hypothetical protein
MGHGRAMIRLVGSVVDTVFVSQQGVDGQYDGVRVVGPSGCTGEVGEPVNIITSALDEENVYGISIEERTGVER